MAKKKVELTPEEKLAQALVPKEEQPYEIPEGWKWVHIGDVASVKGGKRLPKGHELTEEKTKHPYIRVTDFCDGSVDCSNLKYITEETAESIKRYIITDQDVFISIAGTIGKVGIIPSFLNGSNLTENAAKLCELSSFVDNRYLCKVLSSPFSQLQISQSTKTTTQAKLALSRIENIIIPLPPLEDQQRIVERIESLFSKLDEAKEKAQAVVDGFELRKSAILHKAFSGELTAKWREEHGGGLESWEKKALKDILDVRDGTHDSPLYYDEGYALVTSKNLKNGTITDDGIKYISREDFIKINERSKVDIGDILFAMIGTIGNPVVVENEPNFAIKNVALLKNVGKVNPYYVKYYLESQYVKDKMKKEAKGSTQRFVPLGYLRKFEIVVTINDEQKEIVRILGSLLAKEARAKEAAEAVLEQVEVMKKAVLARAFRGEL